MLENFINALGTFSESTPHIDSVIIVGSYARGANKEDSDIDVVIITPNKAEMVAEQDFVKYFGEIDKKQTEYYGACTSIRVWYKNGPEVEFGIVEPTWIKQPLDSGTHRVLRNGYKVVSDKNRYFENLVL